MGQDPSPSSRSRITALLETAPSQGANTIEQLVPLIYDELRTIAHRQLAGEAGDLTLQTTALVHETYLRLAGSGITGRGRAYFFAAVGRAMRQVLVDRARRRKAEKRGGASDIVTLTESDAVVDGFAVELLDLDDALRELGRRSPRQMRVVEYRFFAGMSVDETAEALGIGARTVELDWAMARAWLYHALGGGAPSPDGARST